MPDVEIIKAITPEQIGRIRDLFLEYAAFIKIDLSFQNFDDELAGLPGYYASPSGALLLALVGDAPAGCVALRKMDPVICEMKRLFVRPEYRKMGIGKQLALAILNEGSRLGYRKMRLDSLPTMKEAVDLYRKIGFYEIEPYCYNPIPGAVYMEIGVQI